MSVFSLLMIFLIGNISLIASVVTFMLHNSMLGFVISVVSTGVFYTAFWIYLLDLLNSMSSPEDPYKHDIPIENKRPNLRIVGE